MLSTSLLAVGAVSVSAVENTNPDGSANDKVVNGANESNGTVNDDNVETTVPINGTLGASNTDPDGGLPENDPAWINVTVPIKTTFGATSGIAGATLLSPIYTVQNNSGRPVSVAYESIAQQADTTDNYGLDLTLEATAVKGATIVNKTTNLITAGDIQNPASPTVIANLDAVTTPGATGTATEGSGGVFNFEYNGTVGDAVSSITKVNYTMTLQFKALNK
ncbi:hypothetical protein [uncultured Enterococcus sp.]|uniref:hypothetical protein n=1 Tax=uncultured Enterococcus sp. TaxID=167972 RepID=UPI0025DC1A5B|nr:hypothetical protein [uncultured Enterococcus sp.]